MAQKPATQANQVGFKDLEDLGYQQAGNFDASQDMARFALAQIKGFPDEVPSEAREKLYVGYRKRFNDKNQPVTYAVIGGHYVQPTPEHLANAKVEKVVIGVDFAFSFTSQEFGKLASQNAELHKIVREWREKVTTYCSNRLGDLKRSVRKILNEGKGGTKRAPNKDFGQHVEAFFTDALDKLKTAKARGDSTADADRFARAKVAFMVEWKK
jgi:hypothetical protein